MIHIVVVILDTYNSIIIFYSWMAQGFIQRYIFSPLDGTMFHSTSNWIKRMENLKIG